MKKIPLKSQSAGTMEWIARSLGESWKSLPKRRTGETTALANSSILLKPQDVK